MKVNKKFRNRKWLIKQYNETLEEHTRLRRYEKFDCNSFFRGYVVAKRNKARLKKWEKVNDRRMGIMDKCFKRLTGADIDNYA